MSLEWLRAIASARGATCCTGPELLLCALVLLVTEVLVAWKRRSRIRAARAAAAAR